MIHKEPEIVVPRGIRYLSEWKDFSLRNLPNKCILNKQLPGCGFTNYCLSSSENVILCSPRKMLLKNKAESPEHEKDVFLVVNKYDPKVNIDKPLGVRKRRLSSSTFSDTYYLLNKYIHQYPPLEGESFEQFEKRILGIVESAKKVHYQEISKEIAEYIRGRALSGKPVKILVTYDSFHIVLSTLKQMGLNLENYFVVVDEMQSLGSDSVFKPEVEVNLFYYLDQMKHVCFASATPMLEEFLNMIEEFDQVPYIELDWATDDPGRIVRPDIKMKAMRSVGTAGKVVIKSYLDGDFEKTFKKNPATGEIEVIESRECVLFLNSINHIIHLIKMCKLRPEQCNILCADTPSNQERIQKRLGKSFTIGTVPKKSEPNKMFTFCTRTVYLGADFYSDNARTFIFSDANIETLAVDVGEDLAQIMGRQRSDANPWKNSATFYYITLYGNNKESEEVFDQFVCGKKKETEILLAINNKCNEAERKAYAKKLIAGALQTNYRDDYVAIRKGVPVVNYFVLSNELRVFKMQQFDYRDRASVFTAVINRLHPTDDYNTEVVRDFVKTYEEKKGYYGKMKYLCECNYAVDKSTFNTILDQFPESDRIKAHFKVLGPEKCRNLGYNITRVTKELDLLTASDRGGNLTRMDEEIYSTFIVGNRYRFIDIKTSLKSIYEKYNYPNSPHATDLKEYFRLKVCDMYPKEDGKTVRYKGFIILYKLDID